MIMYTEALCVQIIIQIRLSKSTQSNIININLS